MPGQKGSLLDRIKAFFVRRRQNAIKKKELERKELEEILKNISEKVVPEFGYVVRATAKLDDIDLKKVSLNPIKNSIQVNKKQDIKPVLVKEETNELDEIFDLDQMDINNLKALKSNIVLGMAENNKKSEKSSILIPDEIHIEDKIINDNNSIDNDIKVSVVEDVKKSDDIKESINKIKEDEKKEQKDISLEKNTNKSFNNKILFVSKNKVKVDPKKVSSKRVSFKNNLSLKYNRTQDEMKTSEEKISAILIRMIDKNLYELDYLKNEIEFLRDSNEKAKTKEEMFEIEQRFLILKERLEAVYKEFLKYKDIDVTSIKIQDVRYDEAFVELVEKYKLDISQNDVIKQALIDIENQYKTNLNILESIVALEESKEVLGNDIEKNKTDITVRDEEIQLTSETLEKIDYMKSEIERNLSNNKDIISYEIEKISSIRPEERVTLRFNIVNNLINSALSFSYAFAMMNPRRGRLANVVGAVSMLNGIRSVARIFEPQRQIYYVASNDFADEIKQHLNDYSYISSNIDLSIEEIDKIKLDFDEKYKQYIDDIPEANEAYKKINDLQDQLKDIKIQMKLQEGVLKHSLEVNNSLVKKIEYQNDTNH